MIRTEAEYRRSAQLVREQTERIERERARLRKQGRGGVEIQRALDPLESFRAEVQDEVTAYERLKGGGGVRPLEDLRAFGSALSALRVARGLTQVDLAKRLGVHVSQVSRDERSDYRGVTLERAARILDVLEVLVRVDFAAKKISAAARAARAEGRARTIGRGGARRRQHPAG